MVGQPHDEPGRDGHDEARGRFCPWYPLAGSAERAPALPGVYQIKRSGQLLDYPRGKSAMLRYGHGPELATALAALVPQLADHPDAERFLCRHQITADAHAAEALYRTVVDQFEARFGTPPTLPGQPIEEPAP